MKLDLNGLFSLLEETKKQIEEKKDSFNDPPTASKNKVTTLDLQGLFALFEELEPTLNTALVEEPQQKLPLQVTTEEKVIKMPRLHISEEWGEIGSADREELTKAINLASGGKVSNDPFETLNNLEQGIKELERRLQQKLSANDPGQALSQLVILDTINRLFNSFQASPLGFINEAFIAALYGGQQIKLHSQDEDREKNQIGDVKLQDGTPISIKTIKKDGIVKGSYSNLIDSIEKSPSGKVLFDIFTKKYDAKDNKVIGIRAYRFSLDKDTLDYLMRDEMGINEDMKTGGPARRPNDINYNSNRIPEMIDALRQNGWKIEPILSQYIKNISMGRGPRPSNKIKEFIINNSRELVTQEEMPKLESVINQALSEREEEKEQQKDYRYMTTASPKVEIVGTQFVFSPKNWRALASKDGGIVAEINISKERLDSLLRESLLLLGQSIVSLFNQVDTFTRLIDTYLKSNDPNRGKVGNQAINVAQQLKPSTEKVVGKK